MLTQTRELPSCVLSQSTAPRTPRGYRDRASRQQCLTQRIRPAASLPELADLCLTFGRVLSNPIPNLIFVQSLFRLMKVFGLHNILKFSRVFGEQVQVLHCRSYPTSQTTLKLWKAANDRSFTTALYSSPFSCLESYILSHSFCWIHLISPCLYHFLCIFRKGWGGTKHPKVRYMVTPSVALAFCSVDVAGNARLQLGDHCKTWITERS